MSVLNFINKSFSEFPNSNTINAEDLVLVSIGTPDGYDSRRVSAKALSNALNNQLEIESLDTVEKTVVGAINELKEGATSPMYIGTLNAGDTQITFSNPNIKTTSFFEFFTSQYGINPSKIISLTNGTIVIGFDAQQTDLQVGIRFTNNGGIIEGRASGGSTTVIANPDGEATECLNKIQIANTIYSLANSNVYSTEEIPIGIWIDGKTIYRKVFVNTETIRSSSDVNMQYVGDLNVDTYVTVRGVINQQGEGFGAPIPRLYPPEQRASVGFDVSDNYIRLCFYGNLLEFAPGKIQIILEYTKNE